MKTYVPTPEKIEKKWYLVDAKDKILGRVASRVAAILRGKHKTDYTPFMDVGDNVIIINADKIRLTGLKAQKKVYYRHSGYPGGLKSITFLEAMKKDPTFALRNAIKGMLPHNRLGRKMLKHVRIYAGEQHPHEAQKPEKIEI
ncbi:MAG: 50S ribosomal protein L13 [Spirochaetes bacterium]|nr:MAG: 50S ribosomal protein L13 [Spirochaetota bacterium]